MSEIAFPREPHILFFVTPLRSSGLGCCLLQKKQPVAYASRSQTSNKIQWAQIEKEMTAILFACYKFHEYIYG